MPFTESSMGPVKNSPSGMLCSPAHGIHVRPSTPSVRSVPGAWMCTSLRPLIHSARRRTSFDCRSHAVTGSPSLTRHAE